MAVRMTPRGGGTLATTLTERRTPPAWAWRAQPGPRRPQLPPVVGAHPQGNRAFGAPDWCWTRDYNLQHPDRGPQVRHSSRFWCSRRMAVTLEQLAGPGLAFLRDLL